MILEISEREGEKRMHTKTESILKEGMLVLSGTGPEPYFVGNPPSGRKIPAANHNQYLMETLGLLIFSCIYCDLKDAEIWKAHAIRELERCMEQQVTPCGGQRGRSPRETISGTILPSSVSENRRWSGSCVCVEPKKIPHPNDG